MANHSQAIMKLLSSVFFLLLIVYTCKSSTLEDTCRSFAAGHPSIGYDYCIKTFRADKASVAAADALGLAAIAARIAEVKANATAERIASLIALEKDARRRDRLAVCAEVYSDAVDQLGQAAGDLARGAEGADQAAQDAVTQLSAALDAPGTCEDAFGEADDTSPLATEDSEFKKLATVALAVAALLSPPSSAPRISD
ncbi:putative invertase inhibitor [Phragmites australis]|uniref:putative invertase inhibitor n=1 Tax=Phragmites australis TaxID=29695 RepID=UPI002D782612|nr:putative invertase inhibitor [Phragmites australis]